MPNELIIACAGSGKTTCLVQKALTITTPVLITTFTEANETEIKSKFIQLNGFVPENVVIQTWFSFLIKHGVKPYQSYLLPQKVNGLLLVNGKSGVKYRTKKGFTVCYKEEEDIERYYLSNHSKIYSDKLAKLVFRINKKTNGKIINRLSRVYPNIFIDESQDLAGYDLELVKLLSKSATNLVLVCDPRQTTYKTHHESKYGKYRNGLIQEFVTNECSNGSFSINQTTLSHSFRCNQAICEFSNLLYPNFEPSQSQQNEVTEHDGVFLIQPDELNDYLMKYNPVQLRWNISDKRVNPEYDAWNFGSAKGLTFERVIIYPTKKMIAWLLDQSSELESEVRAKFYVAITRARYSVAIVCPNNDQVQIEGVSNYSQDSE